MSPPPEWNVGANFCSDSSRQTVQVVHVDVLAIEYDGCHEYVMFPTLKYRRLRRDISSQLGYIITEMLQYKVPSKDAN